MLLKPIGYCYNIAYNVLGTYTDSLQEYQEVVYI